MTRKTVQSFLKIKLCLLLVCYIGMAFSQEKTLYYTVENVKTVSDSKGSNVKTDNKDKTEKEYRRGGSTLVRKDNFLVPLILNLIKEETVYKKVVNTNKQNPDNQDVVLNVSINSFDIFLEYQLYLDSCVDNKCKDLKNLESSSFFIDPSDKDYPSVIKLEIQKLFMKHGGINQPPRAAVRVDGKLVGERGQVFYRSNIDTILLNGAISTDYEIPTRYLKYEWEAYKKVKIDTKDTLEYAYIEGFKFDESKQKIVIKDTGSYEFRLTVSDGRKMIKSESQKMFKVEVVEKPGIELHQRNFDVKVQVGLFPKWRKGLYHEEDELGYTLSNTHPSSQLMLEYSYSRDKIRKYLIESDNERITNKAVLVKASSDNSTNALSGEKYIDIPGLSINAGKYFNPGQVYFKLPDEPIPGVHKYAVFNDYMGVKSNVDTLNISYREKRWLYFYLGYEGFLLHDGDDFFGEVLMNALKVSARACLTQRLSMDLCALRLDIRDGYLSDERQFTGYLPFSVKVNYDFYPWNLKGFKKRAFPIQGGAFLSYSVFDVRENRESKIINLWGVGARGRVPLFSKKTNLGAMFLEVEASFHHQVVSWSFPYASFGFNLVYGFWRY
jgi:hypothetical protein